MLMTDTGCLPAAVNCVQVIAAWALDKVNLFACMVIVRGKKISLHAAPSIDVPGYGYSTFQMQFDSVWRGPEARL